MICTSIQHCDLEGIFSLLDGGQLEMAEIRLDRCPLSEEEIEALFSGTDVPLIATCRIAEVTPAQGAADPAAVAESRLLAAIRAGAAFADLEIEAPALMGKHIREACRECGTRLIRSYHDFHGTASLPVLQSVVERCRRFGADIVKVVTTAETPEDADRVLSLFDTARSSGQEPWRLVAFAMGDAGRQSRMECLRLGAPFTYAALTPEEAAAPGQWTTAAMRAWIDGRSGCPFRPGWRVEEPVAMPASKSFAQRAIVAAALSEGTSHLAGYSPCGDNESAVSAARAIGAEVTAIQEDDGTSTLVVRGIAATPGCLSLEQLHTGESGFLTRLMIPLLSVLGQGPVRVTGEKTLLRRPLAGAHDIMASFGVRLYPEDSPAARPAAETGPEAAPAGMPRRKEDCYLPLRVQGPLLPGKADVNGKGGSQLISGLLAALPLCGEKSTLYVHEPRSIPYLFITLDVLKQFGVRIGSEMEGDADFVQTEDWSLCTGVTFRIKPGQRYRAAGFRIEGDWSSAANFLVAGAVFGDLSVSGLDTASLQADLSIMDILTEAGASLSQLEGETASTGILHVQKAPLRPFEADLNHCPDLFPIVAVLAAFCPGETRLRGVGRLAHKETDRAAAIRDMLLQMGVPVRLEEDDMVIAGDSLTRRLLDGSLLRGGRYSSHGDHRMVMALKVASLGADGPVEIDDETCVAKSYPGFHRDWAAVEAAARRLADSKETTAGTPA